MGASSPQAAGRGITTRSPQHTRRWLQPGWDDARPPRLLPASAGLWGAMSSGHPRTHASSHGNYLLVFSWKKLNYSFGRERENQTHPLHFYFKYKLEENKLKSKLLSVNCLSSVVSLPRAPGHHSCGSSTPRTVAVQPGGSQSWCSHF